MKPQARPRASQTTAAAGPGSGLRTPERGERRRRDARLRRSSWRAIRSGVRFQKDAKTGEGEIRGICKVRLGCERRGRARERWEESRRVVIRTWLAVKLEASALSLTTGGRASGWRPKGIRSRAEPM